MVRRLGLLLGCVWAPSCAHATSSPCVGRGTALVVDVDRHQLVLCEQGAPEQAFQVALGRGGVGQHGKGKNRTPLGTYPLGTPRTSKRFGWFISFLGDWGLHGPARDYAAWGPLNTWLDWTRGCVALGTDAELAEVLEWMRRHAPKRIHLVRASP